MNAREQFPFLQAIADGRVNGGKYGREEANDALDEIDSLRAALRLSQDARRGTR